MADEALLQVNEADAKGIKFDDDKYGNITQQALTGVEGAAQGFAGPLATGAERALSAAGVPGLTPEDQQMRAQVNPSIHMASEVGGFGLGAVSGVGEAAGLAKLGKAVGAATGIEGASVASRLALNGIKTGAEVAALQAGNEISKAINSDPNQTLGSAAINIGLSGLLGAGTGVALGGVSELWTRGLAHADGLINDVKGQVAYRQALDANEVPPPPNEASSDRIYDPFTKESAARASPASAPQAPPEQIYDPFTKQWADRLPHEELPKAGQETAGTKLGDWIYDKGKELLSPGGLAASAGKSVGGAAGAALGSVVGHPAIGAYIGAKTLGPAISAIAKPLLEKATDGAALKGSIDYLANAVKGEAALTRAVSAVFEGGKVLLPSELPGDVQREALATRLEQLSQPSAAQSVGFGLGHYLPGHAMAAGALVGQAKGYFDSIRPAAQGSTPFNQASPTHWQLGEYSRALDIAEQPLIVVKRIQEGSLTPKDVATLDALYPGLRRAMGDKLQQGMIAHTAAGNQIPLHQRASMQLLLGSTPTDTSLIPTHMQAIIQSQAQQQARALGSGASRAGSRNGGATGEQIKATEKAADLYSTQLGRREAKR
jgi:hypothetical protein